MELSEFLKIFVAILIFLLIIAFIIIYISPNLKEGLTKIRETQWQ